MIVFIDVMSQCLQAKILHKLPQGNFKVPFKKSSLSLHQASSDQWYTPLVQTHSATPSVAHDEYKQVDYKNP